MVADHISGILHCRTCKSNSLVEQGAFVCLNCGRQYRMVGGIPIMVAHGGADVMSSARAGEKASATLIGRAACWLRKTLSPPSVIYISGKGKITDFISSLGDGATIVDIGSGSQKRGKDVVNLDVFPLPNVDIVFDGRELPIRDEAVDGIISTAVLEHVMDPSQLVSEMFRILRRGGRLLVTVPFLEGFHEAPSDFQRYTICGLDVLFSRFNKIDSGVEAGPSSALAWILQGWVGSFAQNMRVHRLLLFVGGWLVQPIKYFDIILARSRFAHKVAAGLYFVGEKPSSLSEVES
jgi:SAM-dependent methyltransferase/uncharacterized protein YbaR (Trm112 family)